MDHKTKEILSLITPECIEVMKTIHFTADLHFFHDKIISICNRPTTILEHHEWLIKEVFNKYVKNKDTVYILGDLSLGNKIVTEKIIDRLNGNKFLISGNHCKNINHSTRFSQISQIKDFTFSQFGLNIHIVLCHYPCLSWNRKIHNSYHLHGHSHGRNEYINFIDKIGLIYDVGIDNREFPEYYGRPINLYEVLKIMKIREDQIDFINSKKFE